MDDGSYKIEDNKIILEYSVLGEPIANCFDLVGLVYKIGGIEERGYEIRLRGNSFYYTSDK